MDRKVQVGGRPWTCGYDEKSSLPFMCNTRPLCHFIDKQGRRYAPFVPGWVTMQKRFCAEGKHYYLLNQFSIQGRSSVAVEIRLRNNYKSIELVYVSPLFLFWRWALKNILKMKISPSIYRRQLRSPGRQCAPVRGTMDQTRLRRCAVHVCRTVTVPADDD